MKHSGELWEMGKLVFRTTPKAADHVVVTIDGVD